MSNKAHYSIYRQDCGTLTGARLFGSPDFVKANTPAGHAACLGAHDHRCRRVDTTTGAVVPHRPAAPPDDELRTWHWHEGAQRWLEQPTDTAIAHQMRAERHRRMQACDWVTLRAMRTGQPIPPEWAAYMQALADISTQAGWPRDVVWPVMPGN